MKHGSLRGHRMAGLNVHGVWPDGTLDHKARGITSTYFGAFYAADTSNGEV